jgi:hypothetical protein
VGGRAIFSQVAVSDPVQITIEGSRKIAEGERKAVIDRPSQSVSV